jgi:hypothetical protein
MESIAPKQGRFYYENYEGAFRPRNNGIATTNFNFPASRQPPNIPVHRPQIAPAAVPALPPQGTKLTHVQQLKSALATDEYRVFIQNCTRSS